MTTGAGHLTARVALAALLDDARQQIVKRQSPGRQVVLRVPTATFDALAALRSFDLARGNPLLVLGAQVIEDPRMAEGLFAVE